MKVRFEFRQFLIVPQGIVHYVKELQVSTRLTLSTEKDYLHGDNSDIIATDSQKNTVYLLAKKLGIKSPEDFSILLCNHFLSKYSHVLKVVIEAEEYLWNRIHYGEGSTQMQHNHAFVHTPICVRSTTVAWKRNGETTLILVNYVIIMTQYFRILSNCRKWHQKASCLKNHPKFICQLCR